MAEQEWDERLLRGLARYLDEQGVGTYREDGSPYVNGEVGLYFTAPQAGRAITLTLYDDVPVDWSTTRAYVQVRHRTSGSPLDMGQVARTRDALHGLVAPAIAGVSITSISLRSFGRLGVIAGAYEYTQNFVVLARRHRGA